MLFAHRSENGHLEAVIEWWTVDLDGQWTPTGSWIRVNQLEINPDVNGAAHVQRFIQEIAEFVPHAKGAFWERRDHTKNLWRSYFRQQLLKGVKNHVVVEIPTEIR